MNPNVTPSTLELMLLAMYDCGEYTVRTYDLAVRLHEQPVLLQAIKREHVDCVWRMVLAKQLVRMGKPTPFAWRVAARHGNYRQRLTLKDLSDSDDHENSP